ncbi:MAG: hypothetical protein A2V67_03960 [Deltaproteobacteria bacterium RBG_13_61_14]|nr:MAG: hypothetical protein A2V67_03960 [Deltaproteobacteria bacterium RBG_13_61_14]
MSRSGIITLTSDFGDQDSYVAAIKAVILGIFPEARLVDISHQVPAQDITHAAYLLKSSALYFPAGTVHLAVVDPGVGSSRRAIALESQGHFFVGPDNGIFTDFLGPESRTFLLNRPEFFRPRVSATFHGRDIFAPVAGHLAKGADLESLGEPIFDPKKLPRPEPKVLPDRIVGEVIHVDRFGNLITNIPSELIPSRSTIRIMGKDIPGLSPHYQSAPAGVLLALIGSTGLLEISLPEDSAAQRLKAWTGQAVEVLFTGE